MSLFATFRKSFIGLFSTPHLVEMPCDLAFFVFVVHLGRLTMPENYPRSLGDKLILSSSSSISSFHQPSGYSGVYSSRVFLRIVRGVRFSPFSERISPFMFFVSFVQCLICQLCLSFSLSTLHYRVPVIL